MVQINVTYSTTMSSGKFYWRITVVSGSINPGLVLVMILIWADGFLGDNAYGCIISF